jgi:hypothetical protein
LAAGFGPGANDGLLSTASLGRYGTHSARLVAGIAGLVATAMSMRAGEYVSVHSNADVEHCRGGIRFGRKFCRRATMPFVVVASAPARCAPHFEARWRQVRQGRWDLVRDNTVNAISGTGRSRAELNLLSTIGRRVSKKLRGISLWLTAYDMAQC